ncbi:LysR family transcriptional regulator [Pikeienuella piscinae]|uniref:LysR family transcriptional regulator n=1 Tax=Pikeienuella piscinae TaxID=2748098 RepID=A0A7L5BWS2_9RHOB|nr:LysR family transcriptional regulator [Pikeienuella piscinae]QIE54987.1 LysR family transcriptional regulator [Pikeienuella piscinae]
MLNFKQLRAFHEVAKADSVTAAARKLNVSQPAVSLQIKALEKECDLKLWNRVHGRPVLTPAGVRLLGYTERIFALAIEAEREMELLRKSAGQLVVISTTKLIAAYYLPTAIGAFRALHSDVNVQLDIGGNTWAIERVRSGASDLGIVVNPGSRSFVRYPIYTDPLVIIVPTTHRVALDPDAELDFEQEVLILREPGSRTRALAEEALRASGRRIGQILELADAEAVKRAVRAGIGISIITEQAVQEEIEAGNLVGRPFLDGSTTMSIELIYRKDREKTRGIEHFLEAFRGDTTEVV